MRYPATFELPTTDSLTGLATSAYFRHLLREDLLPAARASEQEHDPQQLSLLLLDIDGFLAVNKDHGHQCGDQVLRAVARSLQETFPDTAALARYSGDEFAVALPNTRLDDAFTLAEDLRQRVAALTFDDCPDLRITCSIGLAAFPSSGDSDVELMREVDQALYNARSTRRNKVSLPLSDSRMTTKTNYYTITQLKRLADLAERLKRNELSLLREALDDVLKKYNDLLGGPPKE